MLDAGTLAYPVNLLEDLKVSPMDPAHVIRWFHSAALLQGRRPFSSIVVKALMIDYLRLHCPADRLCHVINHIIGHARIHAYPEGIRHDPVRV